MSIESGNLINISKVVDRRDRYSTLSGLRSEQADNLIGQFGNELKSNVETGIRLRHVKKALGRNENKRDNLTSQIENVRESTLSSLELAHQLVLEGNYPQELYDLELQEFNTLFPTQIESVHTQEDLITPTITEETDVVFTSHTQTTQETQEQQTPDTKETILLEDMPALREPEQTIEAYEDVALEENRNEDERIETTQEQTFPDITTEENIVTAQIDSQVDLDKIKHTPAETIMLNTAIILSETEAIKATTSNANGGNGHKSNGVGKIKIKKNSDLNLDNQTDTNDSSSDKGSKKRRKSNYEKSHSYLDDGYIEADDDSSDFELWQYAVDYNLIDIIKNKNLMTPEDIEALFLYFDQRATLKLEERILTKFSKLVANLA